MLIASLSLIVAFGLAIMAVEIRNSPEGYEDEHGFHFLWQNNSPEAPDVACIWATVGATAA